VTGLPPAPSRDARLAIAAPEPPTTANGTSVLFADVMEVDVMEASMSVDSPGHAGLLDPARSGMAALPRGIPLPLATVLGSSTCALASNHVAAGFPSPADDYVEARIDLNLALIPRPLSTFFMRVSGDAMAGDGILDGDLLVIDRSLEARPGLVVVATHGGAFIVRRLEGRRGSATGRLVASDGLSAPIALAEGEAELWGVVIHAVHHLAGGRPGRH